MAVTPETIAVALGRTAPADPSTERSQWEMWVEDARMLIAARLIGDGSAQVASLDDLDQARLDYVVREAVVDHIKHPDNATQVAVSVDDGSVIGVSAFDVSSFANDPAMADQILAEDISARIRSAFQLTAGRG